MPVLAIFTVRGNSGELLQRYDSLMTRLPDAVPVRPIGHVVTPVEGGIRIYDVWESPERLADFTGHPSFARLVEEAGLPPPEVEVVPVHRVMWQ